MGTTVASPFWIPADKAYAGVPALLQDLESLLNDRTTADVHFIVGDNEIPVYAHKLILSRRSRRYRYLQNDLMDQSGTHDTVTVIKLPQINAVLFRNVLRYVYTGKIELKKSMVFDVLGISQFLGINHLQQMCEEFVVDSLSVTNACHFLNAAMQMSGPVEPADSETSSTGSLVEKCAMYIEQNAEECVKTRGFLDLSREGLLRLLDSEEFALCEEDVWRCVLHWAKHQAGVTKPAHLWTDDERRKTCQYLSGVINHVKLLLIDSTVFAEEVEPTGAVPMELSLERYRFAAVPARFDKNVDKRLRPRVCKKFFPGSQILKDDLFQYQQVLNNWYVSNSKQEWKLLYKASRDGYRSSDFHQCCDGHSPTFVIIQGTNGSICGGFTDVPWSSSTPPRGRYVTSGSSFLFSLVNAHGIAASKFDIVNKNFAVCHHPGYGPIFGAGADICISSECNQGLQSYSNFPHSYAADNKTHNLLMGEYHFNVMDYEVFTPKQIFS
ncbi:BTB/POZ domain-containing protein 9-like [Ptychodera flava]|uniref:BTB/POZ domain-containing protein 9-like n=1 Tax=Ptychodera flava TaxID=63121 RepID=UPI00396AA50F